MNPGGSGQNLPSALAIASFIEKRARKKKSKYDEYFTRIGELAECKICGVKVSWTKNGGTNSLRLHLSTRHKDVFEKLSIDDLEYKRARGLSTKTPSKSTPPPSTPHTPIYSEQLEDIKPFDNPNFMPDVRHFPLAQVTEIDNALMTMICNNQVPVKLLESRDFANVLRTVPQNFVLQPLDYYTQFTLPLLVSNIEDRIRFELSRPPKLAVSIDIFSPENSKNQVCVVSAAYMNPDTMLPKQVLIDYKVFSKEYGNMDFYMSRISNLVDTRVKSLTITSHEQFSHHVEEGLNEMGPLPSFTDLLNEIMHESFAQHLPLIKKQKEILQECFQHFDIYHLNLGSSTSGLSEEVLKSSHNIGWDQHKEVIQMIFDAAERQKSFGGEDPRRFFKFTEEEFEITDLMRAIYKEFDHPTTYINHRYYPTASWIIPTLRVLWHNIEQLSKNYRSPNTTAILNILQPALQSKFEKCQRNMILKTAAFLDPRFRGNFFTEPHESYMQRKFEEYDRQFSTDGSDMDVKPADITGFHYFTYRGNSATPQRSDNFAKELSEYAKEHVSLNMDPSDFWTMFEAKFPLLKQVASEYLAIPASASRAKECYEAGQRICPLTVDNVMAHQNLVYFYANLNEYGSH